MNVFPAGQLTLEAWIEGERACVYDARTEEYNWTAVISDPPESEAEGCSAVYQAPDEFLRDNRHEVVEVSHRELGRAELSITLRLPDETAVHYVVDVSGRMQEVFGAYSSKREFAFNEVRRSHNRVPSNVLTGLRTFGEPNIGSCLESSDLRMDFLAQEDNATRLDQILAEIPDGLDAVPLNRAVREALGDIPSQVKRGGRYSIVVFTGGYDQCPEDPWSQPFTTSIELAIEEGAHISVTIVAGVDVADEQGFASLEALVDALREFGIVDVDCFFVDPPAERDPQLLQFEPCFGG